LESVSEDAQDAQDEMQQSLRQSQGEAESASEALALAHTNLDDAKSRIAELEAQLSQSETQRCAAEKAGEFALEELASIREGIHS